MFRCPQQQYQRSGKSKVGARCQHLMLHKLLQVNVCDEGVPRQHSLPSMSGIVTPLVSGPVRTLQPNAARRRLIINRK